MFLHADIFIDQLRNVYFSFDFFIHFLSIQVWLDFEAIAYLTWKGNALVGVTANYFKAKQKRTNKLNAFKSQTTSEQLFQLITCINWDSSIVDQNECDLVQALSWFHFDNKCFLEQCAFFY